MIDILKNGNKGPGQRRTRTVSGRGQSRVKPLIYLASRVGQWQAWQGNGNGNYKRGQRSRCKQLSKVAEAGGSPGGAVTAYKIPKG